MNSRGYESSMHGNLALDITSSRKSSRGASADLGIYPSRRTYGLEIIHGNGNPVCDRDRRLKLSAKEQIAGRPLNVLSKAESVALFLICSIMAIGSFLIV